MTTLGLALIVGLSGGALVWYAFSAVPRIDMPPDPYIRDLGKPMKDYRMPMWQQRRARKVRNRAIVSAVVVIVVIGGILV